MTMAGLGLSDAVGKGLNAYGAATRMKRDQQDQSWQDEQRGRLRTQQAEEDRLMKARNEANAAGAAVLAGFEREAGQGLGAPERYMNQGGTDSSMPNQAGLDAPVQQPKPFQPKPDQLLKAYEARGQALARGGDFQGFTENFAKIAPLRAEMRNKTIDAALGAYKLDSDIGKLAKTVYSTIDDGKEIADVVKVKGVRQLGADGKVDPAAGAPATFTLKMSDGQMSKPMTAEDMVALAERMRMDPGKVAEYEFKHALTRAEIDAKRVAERDKIAANGVEDRKNIELRGKLGLDSLERRIEGNKEVQTLRNEGSAANTAARVSATITAAQIRKGAGGGGKGGGLGDADKVQSTKTDADGNLLLVMKSGATKRPVNDDGTPMKTLDYQKLVGRTASDIGKSEIGNSYQQNRDAAKKALGSDKPTATSGKDYRGLWSK